MIGVGWCSKNGVFVGFYFVDKGGLKGVVVVDVVFF